MRQYRYHVTYHPGIRSRKDPALSWGVQRQLADGARATAIQQNVCSLLFVRHTGSRDECITSMGGRGPERSRHGPGSPARRCRGLLRTIGDLQDDRRGHRQASQCLAGDGVSVLRRARCRRVRSHPARNGAIPPSSLGRRSSSPGRLAVGLEHGFRTAVLPGLEGRGVHAALGEDHVGVALAGLDELLVAGAHRIEVLDDDAVGRRRPRRV